MTLRDFTDITINVIRESGIAEYLPTFVFPDTQHIQAIEGVPTEVDHRDAIQNVVRRAGYEKREFFFGVKSGPQRITVGHYRPGQPTEFMDITETTDGYCASEVELCDWWRIP